MTNFITLRTDFSSDHHARLILDQPDSKANVLSHRVWDELAAAIEEIRGLHPKALVVESAKPTIFLAGADLREIAALPVDDPLPTRQMAERGHRVLAALESLPFPTVARIDGACLGGGLEVALACDFRIATDSPKVKLGLPEVKLALIPGWGGTQRLPRIIDPEVALRLVATGASLSAEESRAVGLVDLISMDAIPSDWQQRRERKRAPYQYPAAEPNLESLAEDEQAAARTAIEVCRQSANLPWAEALAVETSAFIRLVASPAARAKIAGFLRR